MLASFVVESKDDPLTTPDKDAVIMSGATS